MCVIQVILFAGSDVNSMDSVDSGCALRKSDSCQNSKMGAEPSKMELVIWEIEIPKVMVDIFLCITETWLPIVSLAVQFTTNCLLHLCTAVSMHSSIHIMLLIMQV